MDLVHIFLNSEQVSLDALPLVPARVAYLCTKKGESYFWWFLTVLLYVPIHKQVELGLHFLDQEVEELVGEVVGLLEGSLDLRRALLHRVENVDLVSRLLLLVLGNDWVLVNVLVSLVQK